VDPKIDCYNSTNNLSVKYITENVLFENKEVDPENVVEDSRGSEYRNTNNLPLKYTLVIA